MLENLLMHSTDLWQASQTSRGEMVYRNNLSARKHIESNQIKHDSYVLLTDAVVCKDKTKHEMPLWLSPTYYGTYYNVFEPAPAVAAEEYIEIQQKHAHSQLKHSMTYKSKLNKDGAQLLQ